MDHELFPTSVDHSAMIQQALRRQVKFGDYFTLNNYIIITISTVYNNSISYVPDNQGLKEWPFVQAYINGFPRQSQKLNIFSRV